MDPASPGGGSGPLLDCKADESLAERLGHMEQVVVRAQVDPNPHDGDYQSTTWTLSRRSVSREHQRAREATRNKREARRRRASEYINQQNNPPDEPQDTDSNKNLAEGERDRDREGVPETGVTENRLVTAARRASLLQSKDRSGSVTSDYFSNQNSPIVQQQQKQQKTRKLQAQQTPRPNLNPSARIYANPLCNVDPSADTKSEMISGAPKSEPPPPPAPMGSKLGGRIPVADFRPRSHEEDHYQQPQHQQAPLADKWHSSGQWRPQHQQSTFQPDSLRRPNQMRLIRNNNQQQPDVGHYYCTTTTNSNGTQNSGVHQLNSLASSQQTNETCDESPSNHTNDESHQRLNNYPPDATTDFHFYQMVVPPLADSRLGPEVPTPASPYRSVQRFVGSLFTPSQQQQQQPSSQLSTQTLVSNEPLIRPSSWQHRTLIDLRRQPISNHPSGPSAQYSNNNTNNGSDSRYLESSLVPPGRKLNVVPQVQQQYEQPAELYADDQLRRSLQFLSDKLAERPTAMGPSALATSSIVSYPSGYPSDMTSRYPTSTDSSMMDSPLGKSPPRRSRQRHRRSRGATSWLRRLLFLLAVVLLTLLTLGALTLFNRQQHNHHHQKQAQDTSETNQQQQQPTQVSSGGWPARDATGQLMGDQRHKLRDGQMDSPRLVELASQGNANEQQQQQQQPPVILEAATTSTKTTTTSQLATATATVTTTTTPRPQEANWTTAFRLEFPTVHPARDYWIERQQVGDSDLEMASCPLGCNSHGLCDSTGTCSCFKGFSSPTCSIDDCPNECSHRGECKPKGQQQQAPTNKTLFEFGAGPLDSVGFASLSASLSRNSLCPNSGNLPRNTKPANTHDHRLRWQCECQAGYTGPDCSQQRELQCNDKLDDDLDGLIDCEDDDCCSHPVCLENLMCFKSADPSRALESLESSAASKPLATGTGSEITFDRVGSSRERTARRLQYEWRFMISGEEPVQSYAKEIAFDWSRVAILRGKVVTGEIGETSGERSAGIVSVRISVVENPLAGFTLTRNDGQFDLLVNGNQWLTLQFHRNAYAPLKRRVYVRRHQIQLLDSNVELRLASQPNSQQPEMGRAKLDLPFNLQVSMEMARAAAYLNRADQRARHTVLMDCLLNHTPVRTGISQHLSPKLIGSALTDTRQLRTFAMVSSPSAAHDTQLEASLKWPLEISYNSASSSAVKPVVVVRLLARDWLPEVDRELVAVHLQLDVEGQSRREILSPIAGLSYTFAWNRRNVYSQKIYGFAELNLRVGYQYRQPGQPNATSWFLGCLASIGDSQEEQPEPAAIERLKLLDASGHLSRQIIWFQKSVHLEAHQLNQQADIGKWSLSSIHRLDSSRSVLYLGSGRSLPLSLVYPPVVSSPIQLATTSNGITNGTPTRASEMEQQQSTGRLMARGPNSSVFIILGAQVASARSSSARLVQVDSLGHRKLLDVPLAILTSKFSQLQGQQPFQQQNQQQNQQQQQQARISDDLELVYNNYLATLYLSSRSAGKLVQISLSSLLVLNRTLSGSSPTAAAEDEIDIEPLSGFGRLTLGTGSSADTSAPTRALRFRSPHSLALDEQRQILYLVDGHAHIVALDLSGGGQATLLRMPRKMRACRQLLDYEPAAIRGLSWSEADSSLYFLDGNAILALRSDFSLELLVAGSGGFGPQQNYRQLPQCISHRNLGLIRSISAHETSGDLLVVHQLGPSQRVYLAKLKPSGQRFQQPATLVDLHAPTTWDSMISSLLMDGKRVSSSINGTNGSSHSQIDWPRLAASTGTRSGQRAAETKSIIPFIHLSGGFERAHSVEINSDGSIFVLDSADDSIRLIADYSPVDFNLNSIDHSNINRLFATDSRASDARDRKLEVLSLRHPLSGELMEFHAQSGLHLSSTLANGERQLELHYRLLWNSAAAALRDAGNRRVAPSPLDEDDRRDLEAQRLAAEYLASSSGSGTAGGDAMDPAELEQLQMGAYVRLARLGDKAQRSSETTTELVRVFNGERYVLKSILYNQRPLAELSCDSNGLLASYQRFSGELTLELLYDNSTRLLRETIMIQSDGRPNLVASNNRKQQQQQQQSRRVAYDQLFGHYCDLQTTTSRNSGDPLPASNNNNDSN